jgi:hypothetical protein
MATHTNAELLPLDSDRNPYLGNLGVVEEGAIADRPLVPANPRELIADPAESAGHRERFPDLQQYREMTPFKL